MLLWELIIEGEHFHNVKDDILNYPFKGENRSHIRPPRFVGFAKTWRVLDRICKKDQYLTKEGFRDLHLFWKL